MKYLLIGLFTLVSASSYAMEVEEFYDNQTGDISALISNPSLGDGILISTTSDQNGVCKALGYQRAAVGSSITGNTYTGSVVVVNEVGRVVSGGVATFSPSSAYEIRQIICLNKISNPQERTYNVVSPRHFDSKVPFSTKSSQNGVCKALGYKRAAVGSLISGNTYRGLMVIAAEDSSIESGDVATSSPYSGYEISSLVCLSNVTNP